ncbi:hypothetical protein [Desulfonatronum sp. SC1]|uniref:hypothetical protein n=1 Tax=Desulfonatronum sp. SC1 TaxID=2109626 RepID=UPI0013048770|nr:hypothetical protein [Desulfonatronum sp. SC1]
MSASDNLESILAAPFGDALDALDALMAQHWHDRLTMALTTFYIRFILDSPFFKSGFWSNGGTNGWTRGGTRGWTRGRTNGVTRGGTTF